MSGEDRTDLQPESGPETVATADPGENELTPEDMAVDLGDSANLELLMDVDMKLTVELGRARVKFRDVMNLTTGSVVELSKLTSEPVDIMVNGALLATGEVVVVDDHFAVRITKLINRVERLKRVL